MQSSKSKVIEPSNKEVVLAIIGGISAMIAIAIAFEPSLRLYWWKLAGFSFISVLCVFCSPSKRLVALGIASLVIVRLIIGGGLQLLLRARMSHKSF